MKPYFLLLVALLGSYFSFAQPFAVGHISVNVYDATRTGGSTISGATNWGSNGRAIGTEIYYPATTAGNNTPVANGQFPVVVFGHGFVMTYDSYNTLYEELAKQGFIVALPTTEGGISPTHIDFASDIAYLANQLPLLNNNNAIPLFQNHVSPKAAIGGHSMGAGCSMVGAQNNTSIYALFNMATATTNNNALNSLVGAPTISAPTLILSAERDCVADTNVQIQHYTACGASLKYLAILKNLTHCDFGNGSSITCTLGQSTSGCGNTVPNAQANSAVLYYLLPFLQRTLKNDCAAADSFMNRIAGNNTYTLRSRQQGNLACFPNSVSSFNENAFTVYPNPSSGIWNLTLKQSASNIHWQVCDMRGRTIVASTSTNNTILVDGKTWSQGVYIMQANDGKNVYHTTLIKSE